jgi:hypothetical protein
MTPLPLRAAFAAAWTLGSSGTIQADIANTSQKVNFVAFANVSLPSANSTFSRTFLRSRAVLSKFRLLRVHSGTRIGIKTSIALFGSMVRLSLISHSPDRANAFWMSGAGRASSRRTCGFVAAVTRTTTRTRTRRRAVTMARNHHHHHHSRSWVWIQLPP